MKSPICMYVYIYTHTNNIYIYTHTNYIYRHIHVSLYIYICIDIYIYICIYVYPCISHDSHYWLTFQKNAELRLDGPCFAPALALRVAQDAHGQVAQAAALELPNGAMFARAEQ